MFQDANISIFAGSGGEAIAKRMCDYMNWPLGKSEVIRFSEGNTFVRIHETVRDRDVYVVQPIGMSPNDEFVEILFWMDAVKRASAQSVTLVMPYFGYAKGDKKDEPRVSIRARVCAECIELAGADRLMTMDLHSPQVQGFFKRSMDHLYAMPILAETVRRMKLPEKTVVVSPDAGYAKQARRFGALVGFPVAIGDKTRSGHDERAEVLDIIGEVEGRDALIVDDFSISAGTLTNLAQELRRRGVRRVMALLSHNIVSAEGVKRLADSPIEAVISTDTVDNPHIKGNPMFKTISVAPLFAETIIRYYNSQSISPLFSCVPDFVYDAGVRMMQG